MPEEINNKKLDYLKREEVRTMGKDIAQLRERESEATREKISQIKTGEEGVIDIKKLEQAKQAALEREKIEAEAKEKEDALKKLKEERAASAASDTAMAAKKEEEERELIRAQLKEAQSKEEEARRKFLENISAKAESGVAEKKPYAPPIAPIYPRPVPPPPVPPLPAEAPTPSRAKESLPADVSADLPAEAPTPSRAKAGALPKKPFKFPLPSFKIPEVRIPKVHLPEVKLPKVEGYFPEKPSIFARIWVRILISLFILAVLTMLVTFWYWYLAVRPNGG